MKKLILVLVSCMVLGGCNFLPKLDLIGNNNVPQITEKSTVKEDCKGQTLMDENGNIISCSKGYHNYEKTYDKKERKMTIVERAESFINKILSMGIFGLVIIFFLCPSLFIVIGTFIGKFIEASWGLGSKSFKAVIRAVQKARKEGKDLNTSLETELDADMKKYISKVKEQEKI